MIAFVSGIVPVTSRASFAGSAVCQAAPRTSSSVCMAMSKSVPFLEKPARLDGMPAGYEFDPLLISNYVDPKFLAEAEIKHGRICMLAVLGMLVQEQFTFGGAYFPKMLPIDAHDVYIKTGGMVQIMMAIIIIEAISCYALKETMDGKREPGDFNFDPMGLGKDPAAFKKYQANEIMNGRLAMIACGGIITVQQVYHKGALECMLSIPKLHL